MYLEFGENWTYWLWCYEYEVRPELVMCGGGRGGVPDCVLTLRQGLEALSRCRVPDAAVE